MFYIFEATNSTQCQFIFDYSHKVLMINPNSWPLAPNLHFNHLITYFKLYSIRLVLLAQISILNIIRFNFLAIIFLQATLFTAFLILIKFINIHKINSLILKNLMKASHIFLAKFKFLNFFLLIIQNVFLVNFMLFDLNS